MYNYVDLLGIHITTMPYQIDPIHILYTYSYACCTDQYADKHNY